MMASVVSPDTLVLVPTELERGLLNEVPGFNWNGRSELCGFGPVGAGIRTATLIAQLRPKRILLVGLAGTYEPVSVPIGTAVLFDRVAMYGVGSGNGPGFVSAASMGFTEFVGCRNMQRDRELKLRTLGVVARGTLLTCTTASATSEDVAQRRSLVPDAVVEDMEGFAVALACQYAGIDVAIVRGISNQAGDRDHSHWKTTQAMRAAWDLADGLLSRASWSPET